MAFNQRTLYPKSQDLTVPADLYGKDYLSESSGSSDSKRVQWDADKTRYLLEAIKTVNNGDFLKLLGQPLEEKKRNMAQLKQGWDLVRRIMLRRYPDFSLSRVQLSDKWRKLHCNRAEPSQEFPKKTTEELMKEFKVGAPLDTDEILGLSPEGEVVQRGDSFSNSTEPVIMEYTVQTDLNDVKVGTSASDLSQPPPASKRIKTTEEVIAELENEAYVPAPSKKKQKKLIDIEGRTPVECKRIELMVREHKARMVREGEIFHFERRIKLKKLEILELLKSKLENQQSVNLDVLSI